MNLSIFFIELNDIEKVFNYILLINDWNNKLQMHAGKTTTCIGPCCKYDIVICQHFLSCKFAHVFLHHIHNGL